MVNKKIFQHKQFRCVYLADTKHEATIQHMLKHSTSDEKELIKQSPSTISVNLLDEDDIYLKLRLLNNYRENYGDIRECPVNEST